MIVPTATPKEIGPPCGSMRGNVKRKYFSLELKCAEDWFSAFSPPATRCASAW